MAWRRLKPLARALRAAGRTLAAAARKIELPDVLLAGGTAGVGAGVTLIYLPAGLITVGALLLGGGLRLGRHDPRIAALLDDPRLANRL
jgi:hypothetical protein